MGDAIRYPNMGTVKKAAEIYGLSPCYIRRLCKAGKIRFVNAGHMTDDEFMDLLKQHPELWEPVKRVLKSPNPAAEAQKIIQESQKETSTLHPAG